MPNSSIRYELIRKGIKHYELAKKIGINAVTLSVWMRDELTGERLERVQKALDELRADKEAGETA